MLELVVEDLCVGLHASFDANCVEDLVVGFITTLAKVAWCRSQDEDKTFEPFSHSIYKVHSICYQKIELATSLEGGVDQVEVAFGVPVVPVLVENQIK